jgi:hypothetical protein
MPQTYFAVIKIAPTVIIIGAVDRKDVAVQ